MQTPSYNQLQGTILAGGTLTATPFNIEGYTAFGLMTTTSSANGTLNFLVNSTPDTNSGNWKTLNTAAGAAVAITINSGQSAISSDALTPLHGYKYFHVKSTAQTNGLGLTLTAKAD